MSDWLLKLFGGIILVLCLVVLLKRYNSDLSVLLKSVAGLLAIGTCLLMLSPVLSLISELSNNYLGQGVYPYVSLLLRALAVAFLTHVCANICRDFGENSLASYVELGGKIEILILSIPQIREILSLVEKMLEI